MQLEAQRNFLGYRGSLRFGIARWFALGATVCAFTASACGRTKAPVDNCHVDQDCPDGFCDRMGQCGAFDRAVSGNWGAPCQIAPRDPDGTVNGKLNICGSFLCLEGRCRSCVSDLECEVEMGAPTCARFVDNPQRPGNGCGRYSDEDPAIAAPLEGANDESTQRDADLERLTVEVIEVFPHSTSASTQGLLMIDETVFESTGGEGTSQLRKIALNSEEPTEVRNLDAALFGEGLAHDGQRLIQLTYEAERAFVWDLPDLTRAEDLLFEGAGWGLCHDGDRFIMSDGSAVLQLRDSTTFELVETIEVTLPVHTEFMALGLNELECFDGHILANIHEYREILRISPSDGQVTAIIDTRNLLRHPDLPANAEAGAGELNGIAAFPGNQEFLLTGKRWPVMFKVRFIEDDLFQ